MEPSQHQPNQAGEPGFGQEAPAFVPNTGIVEPSVPHPQHHGFNHHPATPASWQAPEESKPFVPVDTPTPPPAHGSFGEDATSTRPVPVVRVLSPVGVEYVFLTVCLFTAAVGLTAALIAVFNGKFSFSVLSFPAALLLVSVPAFAGLFLHLKKQELARPALKLDPSKRRSTQFTQIASFFVSLFTLVGVVFSIFAKLGGQSSVSIGKTLLDGLAILVVFGGMLAYYWRDEHREQ